MGIRWEGADGTPFNQPGLPNWQGGDLCGSQGPGRGLHSTPFGKAGWLQESRQERMRMHRGIPGGQSAELGWREQRPAQCTWAQASGLEKGPAA